MSQNIFTSVQWDVDKLDAAFAALARYSGLQKKTENLPPLPMNLTERQTEDWLESSSAQLNLELEGCFTQYKNLERSFRGIGPALLHTPNLKNGYLLLLRGSARKLYFLAPNLQLQKLSLKKVVLAFRASFDEENTPAVRALLEHVKVPPSRYKKAMRTLLERQSEGCRITLGWQLRLSQSAGLLHSIKQTSIPRYLGGILTIQGIQYILMLASWGILGKGILSGNVEMGWMIAWFLFLITGLPFSLMSGWWQGMLALEAGSFLKQKLLFGALRLEPDEVTTRGKGHWLAQVIESDAVESMLLGGGFKTLIACVELTLAAMVMGLGSGAALRLTLFVVWLFLVAFLAWRNFQLQLSWTDERISLTNDLVERMLAHRTRIAQEPREGWHKGEDQALEQYLQSSKKMDDSDVWLGSMLPRGWFLLGMIGLMPSFVQGNASVFELALGVGGVFLAGQAFNSFVSGMDSLSGAWIAWKKVDPLFKAASRPISTASAHALFSKTQEEQESEDIYKKGLNYNIKRTDFESNEFAQFLSTPKKKEMKEEKLPEKRPLLEVNDVSFRYHERGDFVLHHCNLNLYRGDRILLEGPSGGGKSTLANILLGIREPVTGLLLFDGFDRQSLGMRGWQKRVTAAPQFHENHVLSQTFSFNLLMGRQWPPSNEDLELATQICEELGLGPLLAKMPAGLSQMVGESGWQLSHGEKSRLFIARALLQHSELIILDESFGSLDPENLRLALECVLRRASTLVVIAHP